MTEFTNNHYNWFKEHGDPLIIDYIENHVLAYPYAELDHQFLGFLDVYLYTEKIISAIYSDGKTIIVDIGCNTAVQQFFFRDPEKYIYIGVDLPFEYDEATFLAKPVYENCKIIENYYPFTQLNTIIEDYGHKQIFGISSYSLGYYGSADPAIINTFLRQFPRHIMV